MLPLRKESKGIKEIERVRIQMRKLRELLWEDLVMVWHKFWEMTKLIMDSLRLDIYRALVEMVMAMGMATATAMVMLVVIIIIRETEWELVLVALLPLVRVFLLDLLYLNQILVVAVVLFQAMELVVEEVEWALDQLLTLALLMLLAVLVERVPLLAVVAVKGGRIIMKTNGRSRKRNSLTEVGKGKEHNKRKIRWSTD